MQTTYEKGHPESQMTPKDQATREKVSWLDRPILSTIAINAETILFATILILAVFSRFYDVGARVMSHDENSHTYYSWRFFRGFGFQHDPLMHGPLQFHLIASTFFLFGDSDFTAHIPALLFSIASVAFIWNYRHYLGKAGALVAATLMLVSPYMLYYGRYVRNEAFVAFFGLITIWAILRYIDTGKARYLYWLTAATVLHFTSKETAFIYVAQALLFLAIYFIYQVSTHKWLQSGQRRSFLLALIVALLFLGAAGGVMIVSRHGEAPNAATTSAPVVPGESATAASAGGLSVIPLTLAVLGLLAIAVAGYFLIRGYGIERLRNERSFGLLVILGTFVLPQLAAFPVSFAGWTIPTNASQVAALTTTDMVHIAIFLVPLFLLSIVIGLWWNPREWLINAAIFYSIFIVFYTSVFTNGAGFFTGIFGSLGYWLEQQGVNRGNQPWYYYWLIQIPVYEFLPALGSLLALILALMGKHPKTAEFEEVPEAAAENPGMIDPVLSEDIGAQDFGPGAVSYRASGALSEPEEDGRQPAVAEKAPFLALTGFWAVTSLIAFTLAGEKMPWLTVHIVLPMILLAGWAIGTLIDITDWSAFRQRRGWLVFAVLAVFLVSTLGMLGSLFGTHPPFQGKDLNALSDTSTFLTALITAMASGIGLFYLIRDWPIGQFVRIITIFIFGILGIVTVHTAVQSSYISYNNANEPLVYAHMSGGVKEALAQIEEISRRTTDGLALPIAYDNETSYPMLWYLRNYTDTRYYGSDPTRSLRDVPVILVGDANYGKIESIVGQAYDHFDYIRIWWPNQDYFGLTWQKVLSSLKDPKMRAALFQIWLNRDYTKYGEAVGRDMSLTNWQPSQHMRLYIRKDIIAELWNYGAAPSITPVQADPYEGKQIKLAADQVFGSAGTQPGQFQHPHGIEVAPDGSMYVADTDNSRIVHMGKDGSILQTWGVFADATKGQAPGGTFSQPWGIGVGPDGSVYVADTWNHRIQKFTPDGQFVKMWGYFGQAERPEAFWGPRDVAVDAKGRVFVTDTGNKRVVVFDSDGNYITQFGSAGAQPGQFDEPVGLTIDPQGVVYVADTWNQRIQAFTEAADGSFQPTKQWDVVAWYGQSLDNKPYLAADASGHIFATDPEGYRILEFTNQGDFVQFWGDLGTGPDTFGLVGGVATDAQNGVWITDAGNSRVMHFTPPAK